MGTSATGYGEPMPIPDPEIVCVDCGGTCYPLGWHPEDGEVEDGTVIPYRCKDCLDRWDVVIGDWTDDADPDQPRFGGTGFGSFER